MADRVQFDTASSGLFKVSFGTGRKYVFNMHDVQYISYEDDVIEKGVIVVAFKHNHHKLRILRIPMGVGQSLYDAICRRFEEIANVAETRSILADRQNGLFIGTPDSDSE